MTIAGEGRLTEGSELDRDSFGEHLRRNHDNNARHSLDDPFSHEVFYDHQVAVVNEEVMLNKQHSSSSSSRNSSNENSNGTSHGTSYEGDEGGDRDRDTQLSTGSWLVSTVSKFATRHKFWSAMKQTMR